MLLTNTCSSRLLLFISLDLNFLMQQKWERTQSSHLSLDQLMQGLREKFQPIGGTGYWISALKNRKKSDKESVVAYSLDLEELMKKANSNMTDGMRIHQFLSGLPPDYQDYIRQWP